MTNERLPAVFGGISRTEEGVVMCLRCNRPVDQVIVETPVDRTMDDRGLSVMRHTGEIILTVQCHGEKWMASNWRGLLERWWCA